MRRGVGVPSRCGRRPSRLRAGRYDRIRSRRGEIVVTIARLAARAATSPDCHESVAAASPWTLVDSGEVVVQLDPNIEYQLGTMVDELEREFGDRCERSELETLVQDSVERLAGTAAVGNFLPILAYRFARERLSALERARSEATGLGVVFVSLSGGGRAQLAAALTALLSGGRVAVHSAGTAVEGSIDPAVREAIEELGIDTEEAFVRPASEEVLRAADVIVTMGYSVGSVEIPAGARHLDWRVGDPSGADLAEVRRVRADIERRVRELLEELGVSIAQHA
jgi:arsenate reductase (thioredoxin)